MKPSSKTPPDHTAMPGLAPENQEPAQPVPVPSPASLVAATAEPAAVMVQEMPADPTSSRSLAQLQDEVHRLSEELRSLRAQVGALCELERFRDVVLERHPARGAPPPSRMLQARDFVDNADGFHNLEYDEKGMAYRWTGPGHFTRARLYVDRSTSTMVVLTLSSLGRHTVRDRITVDVDGTVYPMHRLGGAGITLRAGPLPPREEVGVGQGSSLTDLFFHIPVTFSPRDSGTDDARVLGVAVLGIEIVPHT